MNSQSKDRPDVFYKYMGSDTAKIVLQNRTLRWSTPRTLNDPLDMQFELSTNYDRPLVKRLALERLYERHYAPEPIPAGNKLGEAINLVRGKFPRMTVAEFAREFDNAISETFERLDTRTAEFFAEIGSATSNLKVLCLSATGTNTPMWAHYANNHTGTVLGFVNAADIDSPYKLARPISYVDEFPNLFTDEELADLLSGGGYSDYRRILDSIIYTKHKKWEYEDEWRLCSGEGREKAATYEDVEFHSGELACVALGINMDADDREEIVQLTRSTFPNCKVYDVAIDRAQGEMVFSPVTN